MSAPERMIKHSEQPLGKMQAAPADEDAHVSHARDVAAPAQDATPVMAQYLEIKAANPDSLLWYRMGDFYELFFQDAVAASEALSIVLTKRGKHLGEEIPMCGVPIHRADEYLQRLIRKGFRVAVCEQLEDPAEARKRGAKAVVKRDVVRLVTPGTITEEALLEAKTRNYLTALFTISARDGGVIDAAAADARTLPTLPSGGVASPVPAAYFDSSAGARDLKAQLGVAALDGFGTFTRTELAAIGGVLKYIALTQMGQRALLRPPRKTSGAEALTIDAASRSSLELVRSTSGDTSSTLLAAMDRTVTGAGARELQARLSSPLADPDAINARLR